MKFISNNNLKIIIKNNIYRMVTMTFSKVIFSSLEHYVIYSDIQMYILLNIKRHKLDSQLFD